MSPRVRVLHALALDHLRRDEFAAAALVIRRLLLVLPPDHESRAAMLVTLAFAHLEAGDVEEAERVARHAIALDPKSALAAQQLRRAERAREAS